MAQLVVTTTWKGREADAETKDELDVGNVGSLEQAVCAVMCCPRAVFDQKIKTGELWVGDYCSGYWGRDGDNITFQHHTSAPVAVEKLTFSLTC